MEDVVLQVVEEVTTTYTIDDVCLLLSSIDSSLKTLLAIVLLLICIRFVWTVLSKWLFGGI